MENENACKTLLACSPAEAQVELDGCTLRARGWEVVGGRVGSGRQGDWQQMVSMMGVEVGVAVGVAQTRHDRQKGGGAQLLRQDGGRDRGKCGGAMQSHTVWWWVGRVQGGRGGGWQPWG